MSEYKTIAVSCKAKELLEKLIELNPSQKKFILVSELIQNAYDERMKGV